MYFIYLIKYQRNKLALRINIITAANKKYIHYFASANAALCQLDSAQMDFSNHRRTFLGKLRSFIPGTRAFKSRVRYARCISNAHSQLNEVVRSLKPVKDTPVVTGNNKKKMPPNLPEFHRSPINAATGKKQTKNTNNGYVFNAAPRLS